MRHRDELCSKILESTVLTNNRAVSTGQPAVSTGQPAVSTSAVVTPPANRWSRPANLPVEVSTSSFVKWVTDDMQILKKNVVTLFGKINILEDMKRGKRTSDAKLDDLEDKLNTLMDKMLLMETNWSVTCKDLVSRIESLEKDRNDGSFEMDDLVSNGNVSHCSSVFLCDPNNVIEPEV
jgi:hypothetical protein